MTIIYNIYAHHLKLWSYKVDAEQEEESSQKKSSIFKSNITQIIY